MKLVKGLWALAFEGRISVLKIPFLEKRSLRIYLAPMHNQNSWASKLHRENGLYIANCRSGTPVRLRVMIDGNCIRYYLVNNPRSHKTAEDSKEHLWGKVYIVRIYRLVSLPIILTFIVYFRQMLNLSLSSHWTHAYNWFVRGFVSPSPASHLNGILRRHPVRI